MSINRWMDKEAVVHIHNGILLRHKKNISESVLRRWMNLEPIIQSEVSQKEKNKYSVLTHIYDFLWKFLSLRDENWCKVILLIERMMRHLEFISKLEMKQNWPWLNACWRWAHDLIHFCFLCWASLVAQLVKNPPTMQETWVRSLGWKDPLEKG